MRSARQIAELAASVAGQRRVSDANLHLTLVFLGATNADRLAAYRPGQSADLPVPTLDLYLDRYGYWPQSRILWLGCSRAMPELDDLVAKPALARFGLSRSGDPFKRISPWPAIFPARPCCNFLLRRCVGESARWR